MKPMLLATMGDPSGIGPETFAAAWEQLGQSIPFTVIGCANTFQALGIPVQRVVSPQDADPSGPLPVLDRPLPPPGVVPGKPSPTHAAHVVAWIAEATEMALRGEVAGIITGPINKKALQDGAGFGFPGHTEYLASLTGVERSIMMLTGAGLRVVPVTIHIPLKDVPEALSPELLEFTLRGVNHAMRQDFQIAAPRIAVAGLNPHAGEQGAMGFEEIETIIPVIDRLKADGMDIRGPLPADAMFHPRARENYDVAVCMYHDQALIPLKTIAFDEGVNLTLGLPMVRTSPDHGTAFDIAGTGKANAGSTIAAIELAAELAARRSTP